MEQQNRQSSENEEQYGSLLEAIEEGYYEVDLAGNFTFFNKAMCRILGYAPDEMRGMNNRQFTDKENAKKLFETFNRVYKTGESTKAFDWQLIRKDGNKKYIETSVSLIKDASGKPTGFKGIVHDITERKQAEEALRESEALYRLLADNISEHVWVMDLNLNLIYISPSVEKIYGYALDEISQIKMRQLFTADSYRKVVETFMKELEKAMNSKPPPTGTNYIMELEAYHKDGHKIWIENRLHFIRDKNGKPVSLLGETRDITDRKLAQEALKASEEKYRLLADHMKDQVWMMDMNMQITYVSPSVERITGYSFEEIKILPLDQLLTPESVRKAMEFITNRMPKAFNLASLDSQYRTLELEFRTKEGKTIWGECSFNFIRNENNEPISILGEARNITDRKIAEDKLRQSEEKYRTILEDIKEGYFETDLFGNFTFFNDTVCRVLGYSRNELTGMSNKIYTDAEERKKVYRAFHQVYMTGEPYRDLEWQIRGKDGTRKYIEGFISLLRDSSGNPKGFRGIAHDITERKIADEKLQKTLESLKKAVGTTIQVLISALEARDPYTAGHQSRTANLACAIAAEMGLDGDIVEGLNMAGTIHDIGKLSIPAEILSKPTGLTNIEFSMIKTHPESGYEMLKDVESPWPLSEIVYQHHERMDGSGYPRNLKGNDILIEARIMAVADVVEAIASHRPYRPSLGLEFALKEIEKNRGKLYDEKVVDACLKLFIEKGYQLA